MLPIARLALSELSRSCAVGRRICMARESGFTRCLGSEFFGICASSALGERGMRVMVYFPEPDLVVPEGEALACAPVRWRDAVAPCRA